MVHFNVSIPENKINFFIELIQSLNFAKIEEQSSDFVLSDAHKDILDRRLENYKNNPESYIDKVSAKNDLKNRIWPTG